MNRIENDTWGKVFIYRNTQKFSNTLRPIGGKCLKRILKYLYFTKYNKINTCHSDIPKHVSYKKCYEKYR